MLGGGTQLETWELGGERCHTEGLSFPIDSLVPQAMGHGNQKELVVSNQPYHMRP